MKKSLFILLLTILACVSCQKEGAPEAEPQLVVNFSNTKGIWKLATWRGESLPDGVYLYLKLDQKDKTFLLYDNMNSIYGVKHTGRYNLYEDEAMGMVMTGEYDYTYDYWAHDYRVSSLTASKMELTAVDDNADVTVYERADEIPGLE